MKDLKYNKKAQRIAGFLMLFACGGYLWFLWHKAISTCTYKPGAMYLFSMFAAIGVGLLLFPIDHAAIERKYGTPLNSFQQLPRSWKITLALGLIATIGNLLLMENIGRFIALSCIE